MDIWMNDRRLCARAPGATPRYDGEAARKAGIPFVGVLSRASPKQELKQHRPLRSSKILQIYYSIGPNGETSSPNSSSSLDASGNGSSDQIPHLVQILLPLYNNLPLYDNDGRRFPNDQYQNSDKDDGAIWRVDRLHAGIR